jgi:hypothetical protein
VKRKVIFANRFVAATLGLDCFLHAIHLGDVVDKR